MKKIIALLAVLSLLFAFSACGSNDDTSSDTSSDPDAITITPSQPTEIKDNIEAHDPTNSETHTITDEGSEVDRTTNQMLEAADFVSSTCALTLAVRDGKLGTTVQTDSLSMEYYCRAVQLSKALNGEVELSKADFDKVIYDSFGVKPDSQVYQMSGITSYSNGLYIVEEFSLQASWGLHFDSAEVLGNGYVRYTGVFTYDANGSLETETEYKTVCLVKHTTESSLGFQLLSFEISK